MIFKLVKFIFLLVACMLILVFLTNRRISEVIDTELMDLDKVLTMKEWKNRNTEISIIKKSIKFEQITLLLAIGDEGAILIVKDWISPMSHKELEFRFTNNDKGFKSYE